MGHPLIDGAEEEFLKGKYGDAFDMACLAREMYTDFPRAENFVAAYGVHLAATESNWYEVLGLHSAAVPTEEVKKAYLRLVGLVHPGLHQSAAADGAFKLIKKAWKVLGDKRSRLAYHRQCGWQQPTPKQDGEECYVGCKRCVMENPREYKRQRRTLDLGDIVI